MTSTTKEIYDELFNIIEDKSKFIYCDNNVKTIREKLWHELSQSIYVIGTNITKFNEQAVEQGFDRLVNWLVPYSFNDALNDIDIGKRNIIKDWINENSSPNILNFGCHISHILIAKDMLKRGLNRALVFENDCAFKNYVSNEMLETLIGYYKTNNIDFLNLGTNRYVHNNHPYKENVIFNGDGFIISKNQNILTHSYLMNDKTAFELARSSNINESPPKKLSVSYHKRNNYEQCWRGGADEFFVCFINQHAIYPAITYQQYIGNNKEIITSDIHTLPK